MSVVSPSNWRLELQRALLESFGLEDLDLLCFGLDVAGEEATTPAYKAMKLINQMEQRQRLSELLDACHRLQPAASWRTLRHLLPATRSPIPLSERFQVTIEPAILPAAGQCEVIIYNQGTRRTNYTIRGQEQAIGLNFSGGQGRQKIVAPGQRRKVRLDVSAKKRPLFGRSRLYPFTVQVSTLAGSQQSIEGQIIVKPLFPVWAVGALVVLLLVLLAGGAWRRNGGLFKDPLAAIGSGEGTATSTATAVPILQPVKPTGTAVVPTQTAVPLATATQTPTATPTFEFAEITSIGVDEAGQYLIHFRTFNFRPDREHLHVHFFFDTVAAKEAGVPGSGWRLYGDSSPFTGYSLADRPAEASAVCILVANGAHQVRLGSGNCFALP